MPNARPKEIALLCLPVVLLIGFAYYLRQPAGDGSLKLVKTSVRILPGSTQTTIVDVVVKYDSPSKLPASLQGDQLRYCRSRLVDNAGKAVFTITEGVVGSSSGPEQPGRYRFTEQFSLFAVPKSLRPLTAHFEIAMGDEVLPVAVKVP